MSFLTLASGKHRICFEKYVIKTENQHLWWMFVTLTVEVRNKFSGHSENTCRNSFWGTPSVKNESVTWTGRSAVSLQS